MAVLIASNLICAVVYLGLAFLLALHSERRPPALALIGVCAITGAWAALSALAGARDEGSEAARFLEVLQAAGWVSFLIIAHRAGLPRSDRGSGHWIGLAIVAGLAATVAGLDLRSNASGDPYFQAEQYLRVILSIMGLVLAEVLLRQARSDGHWRVTYLCLGVGGLLVYDLFVASQAALLHRPDPVLEASRGLVCALAAPLIAVAAARNPVWSVELNVARRAVYQVGSLYAVAIYFLLLGLVGVALRGMDREWGPYAQVGLLFTAVVALGVAWFSSGVRGGMQRGIARSFFTHRHDYREQWFRFTEALASPAGGGNLRERTLRAIAQVVESPGGCLWLREGDVLVLVAGRLPSAAPDEEPGDGPLAAELDRISSSVVLLEGGKPGEPRLDLADLPEWLRGWKGAWLVVPLVHYGESLGFVILTYPPGRRSIDSEDRELLEAVANHAASTLSAEQTTMRLGEVQRFQELSRGTAFIAHDLRNLANELSLTLANTRKHVQNPEFQRDLLLSMEESVAGMQRLLDKLRDRPDEPARSRITSFSSIIRRSLRIYEGARPVVEIELPDDDPLNVHCDVDRLLALSGHLVRNAVEAAGPDGRVGVRLAREGDRVLFDVTDDGPGMETERTAVTRAWTAADGNLSQAARHLG